MNSFWSSGATPKFVQNSTFFLKSGEIKAEELETFENATKNLKGVSAFKMDFWKPFGFEKEPQLLNDILQKLSPSLRSLELTYGRKIKRSEIFLLRASIQFQVLTTLTFLWVYFDEDATCQILSLLYAAAPNLTQLVVDGFQHVLTPLLLYNADADADGSKSRNWALAPKLKALGLSAYSFIPTEDFLTLLNFPQTWHTLELELYLEDAQLLLQFLEKTEESLVNLKLGLRCSDHSQKTLRFPTKFPKIWSLELNFKGLDCHVNFGGRLINYSEVFPALASLSVGFEFPPDFYRVASIWDGLFPSPQIFEGLKHLKLKFGRDYDDFLLDQGIRGDWAATLFPNATIHIN